jgi:serine/threonine-protein kinase
MAAGRLGGTFVLVLLSFGLPGRAAASGGSDAAIAEALFQEGRKLVEQKRYPEACPKFAESQRLDPGIGTLLNLAACHELEGKTATSWSEFTQALGQAERESRSDAQQFARTHLAALTPKLPKIVISVPADSEAPGLEVKLDGQPLGKAAWGVAAPIDPGTHVVAAVATGRKPWTTQATFAAGEQKTVVVPALEVDAERATSGTIDPSFNPPERREADADRPREVDVPRPPPPAEAPRGATQRTAGVIVGGAGVVAMAAGVILGLSAKATYDDSASHCDASGCDATGLDTRSRAVGKGQVATALFALGAGTAVGGAVLWFTAPHPASARVAPFGLAVSGRW